MDSDSNDLSRVTHQPADRQFTYEGDAVLQYAIEAPARFVITHTGVPTHLRGRGIAAKLTEAALLYAEQNQLEVVAQCSYVAAYIERRSGAR